MRCSCNKSLSNVYVIWYQLADYQLAERSSNTVLMTSEKQGSYVLLGLDVFVIWVV